MAPRRATLPGETEGCNGFRRVSGAKSGERRTKEATRWPGKIFGERLVESSETKRLRDKRLTDWTLGRTGEKLQVFGAWRRCLGIGERFAPVLSHSGRDKGAVLPGLCTEVRDPFSVIKTARLQTGSGCEVWQTSQSTPYLAPLRTCLSSTYNFDPSGFAEPSEQNFDM